MNREQRRKAARRGKRAARATLIGGTAAVTVASQLVFAPLAHAASFEVTNLDDGGAGSLRQAIIDANNTPGPDTITFQTDLTGTISLTTGELVIDDSVTITGPGADLVTIDAGGASRIFTLDDDGAVAEVSISGLTLQNGDGGSLGGAIANFDEHLTLTDMVLTGNQADQGGAVYADGFDMQLTIMDSQLTGNMAFGDGGAIYVGDTGAPVTISGTIISGNTADDDGGGIYFYDPDTDVTITDSFISGNAADDAGGGIAMYDTNGGEVLIERTTISGNASERGGGVWFYGPDDLVTIDASTISGNSSDGDGGGIYFEDAYAPVIIRSSTISGNTAAEDGGGVHVDGYAEDLLISHSTITANDAGLYGGGIALDGGFYIVALDHTIVAGNIASDQPDVQSCGCGISANWSLIGDPGFSVFIGDGNLFDVDPLLGPLENNGGPTETHALLAGSPAIDAGNPDFVPPPATDQRGADRVVGPVIDIGAYELLGPAADDTATVDEDETLTVPAPGVLANDRAGTDAWVTLVTDVANGTLDLAPDGSYVYTPNPGFHGTDSFVYTADTPFGLLGNATVTITVNPVNDGPIAADQTATVQVGQSVLVDVLAGSTDPDGDPLTVVSATQGARGTTVVEGNAVRYTPTGSDAGTDTFQFTISDGQLTSTATVTVTIVAAPTPTPDTPTNVGGDDLTPSRPSSGSLPATGGNPLPLGAAGAGLLGAGSALLAAARRRLRRG